MQPVRQQRLRPDNPRATISWKASLFIAEKWLKPGKYTTRVAILTATLLEADYIGLLYLAYLINNLL